MGEHIFTVNRPLAGIVLLTDTLQLDGAFLVPWLVREACSCGYKVVCHFCRIAAASLHAWLSLCEVQVLLIAAQDSPSHYLPILRKLVRVVVC